MDKVTSNIYAAYMVLSAIDSVTILFLKRTYDKTSKFDLSIEGWGGEDLRFYETCVKYKVGALS